jgi:hypothetical protein
MDIYQDNGAAKGLRTRMFRDGGNGGVEWMYAVDYASGYTRWYGYGMEKGLTIRKMMDDGMHLVRHV